MIKAEPFRRRRAGILLHIASLPGPDLGPDAYRFVDFLAEAGVTVWQVLPLGPTHEDRSPYQCLSAHAGNPDLISIETLAEDPWFDVSELDLKNRALILQQACRRFRACADRPAQEAFAAFCREQAFWLDDYVLFQALREAHGNVPWFQWPRQLRARNPEALRAAAKEWKALMDCRRFAQFIFFRQWLALKAYANRHGVLIFGDMPIFVAHDSADVWARQEYFTLDENSRPTVVAGVPPDYFSSTGQCWGNPLYRWHRMEAEGFAWWLERMRTQLKLYDIIRIDHFRGFDSHWEIPAESRTAAEGQWVKAPGRALFRTLEAHYGALPLVAEDLGTITPAVRELRDRFKLPGMKVLQFAFEGDADNPYLPWNHVEHCIVYTGTHDNDTTLGWFNSLSDEKRHYIYQCLGDPAEPMPWALIHSAFHSVAEHVVVPMQDILGLGDEARMNLPGTTEGNWRWQFEWSQLQSGLTERIRDLVDQSKR